MLWRRRGLTFKQSFYTLTATALIFIPVVVFTCITTGRIIFNDTEKIAKGVTEAKANELDQSFLLAMSFAKQTALMLEKGHYKFNDLNLILNASMDGMHRVRGIYGCSIAFAPYIFQHDKKYFMTYVHRKNNRLVTRMLGSEKYDYFNFDWFKQPAEAGKASWSNPYYDQGGGNILMTTYSVPFYRVVNGKKQFQGVVTVDISLTWLNSLISSMKIFPSSSAFIVSCNGRFIAHTEKSLIMKSNLLENAKKTGDQLFINNIENILSGRQGFFPHYEPVKKKKIWACYTPLQTTKWSLAVAFPEDELLAGLVAMEIKLIIMALGGFILLFWVVLLITVRVTRPLKQLTEAVEQTADGNFNAQVPQISSLDEIGVLSRSFAAMQQSLTEYIKNLATTTAAKEKIESELNIARDIQLKIIPNGTAPFPKYSEFKLAAFIESAKAVGGDLYDFFFIDQQRLCLVVGDVSGKGVPAALFMSASCKLLRGIATATSSTGEIMTKLSKGMGHNNDMMMFVTCFFAILDIKTGLLEYTNAGHNPPYLIKSASDPVEITDRHGPPLAISETEYSSSSLTMLPGDTIMIYTDGVNEAMNRNHEQFGNAKLAAVLQAQNHASPQQYITAMKTALDEFTDGFEASDDITMLAVTYNG
jgi:sigma-B regulation protein RsbU (phosphoserine phosphatase)